MGVVATSSIGSVAVSSSRVTRSVLVADLHAFVLGLDRAYAVREMVTQQQRFQVSIP